MALNYYATLTENASKFRAVSLLKFYFSSSFGTIMLHYQLCRIKLLCR